MKAEAEFPVYRIEIEGTLDPHWCAWFDGFTITPDSTASGHTSITGCVADQAALRGILNKLWDLNLVLLSVKRL